MEKVRAIPGVKRRLDQPHPFTNFASATFYLLEGQSRDRSAGQVALIRNVSRDYWNRRRAAA